MVPHFRNSDRLIYTYPGENHPDVYWMVSSVKRMISLTSPVINVEKSVSTGEFWSLVSGVTLQLRSINKYIKSKGVMLAIHPENNGRADAKNLP